MRYRPFGKTGIAISSISLALTDAPRMRPKDWVDLVYSAMENGINAFEIVGQNPAILDAMAQASHAVERRLLFVGVRLGASPTRMGRDFSPRALFNTVEGVIARTGLEYLDLAMLDDPGNEELSPDALAMLKDLRSEGRARYIGVTGEGDAIDAYISTRAFDVLGTPYNLLSGWRDRHRVKAAQERDMPVIGYDFYSEQVAALAESAPQPKKRWFSRPKPSLTGIGTYAFMTDTPGWTPEEIALGFALTEPSIATMQVTTDTAPRIADLAKATERDLPPGASSRIEMARFGAQAVPKMTIGKA